MDVHRAPGADGRLRGPAPRREVDTGGEADRSYHTTSTVTIMGLLDITPPGVVSGKDVYKVFDYARENHFAIPAFNVTVCSFGATANF